MDATKNRAEAFVWTSKGSGCQRTGLLVLLTLVVWPAGGANAWGQCGSGPNPIVRENNCTGNPPSEWDISGIGDPTIQGFATDISVNVGQTVFFKINTDASAYQLDIYRMGYYAGNGARKVATVLPSVSLPQNQPACLTDTSTYLYDCGNWAVSASWTVPLTATSGIYFAKAIRSGGVGSHIFFIVRDDSSQSDLLFQTADETWQAYNYYGGHNFYGVNGTFDFPNRAYKGSYNRPFWTRIMEGGMNWVFNAEYPMVRWLEANGYDVTYFTAVDAARTGNPSNLIRNHRVYLSVGHDEYWSKERRDNVEAARAAGVNLAFFSGNEIFSKTRWENSIDGSGTPYRTLVCYKESFYDVHDPADPPTSTGSWRDPTFGPPADGYRPENGLSGTIFKVNGYRADSIQVPAEDGKMRFWRNTSVATQSPGQTATFGAGTLGYEWDMDLDNGFRPPGLIRMSTTTVQLSQEFLQDYFGTYGAGTGIHHLTLYRHPSGALVFGAGTVQWSWGLDVNHDPNSVDPPADLRMQQATVNLLADMGVQPTTLQADLTPATASTDAVAPISLITLPTAGSSVQEGTQITIAGTASDSGGGVVGGVEVSVDGGTTWHPADGRASWTYTWTPNALGSVTIRSRAVDDSGNLETPSAGVTLTVTSRTCPCGGWNNSTVPGTPDSGPDSPVELGVKFRTDVNGSVTGVRFYKSSANTGTHVGNLWSSNGVLLGSVTFTNETASGWQQAFFSSPVSITANTTYVVSYFAPSGHYSFDGLYFLNSGLDNPPIHLLKDGIDGGNGVYSYGSTSTFPVSTYQSGNYWVDLVFTTSAGGGTGPSVISVTPNNGATSVSIGTSVTAVFNTQMDSTTINATTFALRDPSNGVVPVTVNYDPATSTATLTPGTALLTFSTYTATLLGGTTGVKDTSGNSLTANFTWSFTTGGPPPNQGPGGPILVISSVTNPFSSYFAEVLRAEGLNEFTVADISAVDSTTLSGYDVAILGNIPLTSDQVTMLSDWVNSGGNLIAMRPDKQLATLLGLTDAGGTLANGYLLVNTGSGPGVGIVNQTIQFHGSADLYTLNGATSVATLYSNATTATSPPSPAVTLRSVGSGHAAAFTYDLARSVVYTRQGNPAWSGQERDGVSPIRPDDLFYGAAASDPQPDWIDLNKVSIPQADEQQRLLANLILQMNAAKRPLPRFWYFPFGFKAAVIMTGDDHGSFYGGGATAARFDQYLTASSSGCSVAYWQCVRATSYVFPPIIASNPLTNSQAVSYVAQGFEVALHVDTVPDCSNYTFSSLDSAYSAELSSWKGTYSSLPSPSTNRTHCISWSDYDSQPQVELSHGTRLDTSYYYWPPSWINDRPGVFTGSGMPMRFAKADGTTIDVYQATTQMTDESGQSYPETIDALLDNALGPQGFYGAFAANMHNDSADSQGANAIVASAQFRGVPIVSSLQMLHWLDGRNGSSFGSITLAGNVLSFIVVSPSGEGGASANGIQAMLPVSAASGSLTSITLNGSPVTYTTQTIKGIQYAFFSAAPGTYQATYGVASGVRLAPTSLSYGNQAVGTTSPAQTVTLTNGGSAALTISGVSITGTNPGDFAVSQNNCPPSPSTLAPNASCTISVTFTPTTTGSRSATLSVSDDASGSPQTASLSGTGVASGVSLSPTSLSYGNQVVGTTSPAQTVTLTNGGTAALTINSIGFTGSNVGDFGQTNNCPVSPATLAANASCSISVTFTPTTTGSRTATLSVSDNGSGSPQTASLSGTGIAPAVTLSPTSLSYGNQVVGTASDAKAVTLSNSGTAALTITSVSITGANAGDFAVSQNTCPLSPATLATNGSCTINITFKPTATGARSAAVTINDNASGSPQSVGLTGTGVAPVVSLSPTSLSFGTLLLGTSSAPPRTVTLSNTGTASLSITGISITGTNAGDFAQTNTCGTSVAAGANCTISVTFTPTSKNSRTASLSIADNAAGSPQRVSLSGTGTFVQLSPPSLVFGNQAVGTTSAAQTVIMTNASTSTAVASISISIGGTNPGNFAQTNNCGTSLGPGLSCMINVTFRPNATGSRTATLRISDDGGASPQTMPLSGTGVRPVVTLSPTGLTFPTQVINTTSAVQPVTLTNVGPGTLTITSIGFTGTNRADFSQTNTCGSSVNEGANCTINVRFTPASKNSRTASLAVTDNGSGSPQRVSVAGTGTFVQLSSTSLAFGNQAVGTTSAAQSITMTNKSTTTSVTSISIRITGANAGDFSQSNTCTTSRGPGASCTISVSFRPTDIGSRSASVSISDNGGGSPQTVNLSGTGQ